MRKQSYLQIAAVALTLIVLAYIVYLPVGVADGGGFIKRLKAWAFCIKNSRRINSSIPSIQFLQNRLLAIRNRQLRLLC